MKLAHVFTAAVLLCSILASRSPGQVPAVQPTEVRPSEPKVATPTAAAPTTSMQSANANFKREIEVWNERIRNRIEKLNSMDSLSGLENLTQRKLAADQLVALVDDLREEAEAIIEVGGGLEADLGIYRQSLLKAPQLFQEFSMKFQQRTSEVESLEMREAYADYAMLARKLGASYHQQALELSKTEVEIQRRIQFVREAKTMLEDLRELLLVIPKSGGDETVKVLQRISTYAEAFKQSIRAIRVTTEKFADPNNSSPQTPSVPPAATSSTPTGRAKSISQKLEGLGS